MAGYGQVAIGQLGSRALSVIADGKPKVKAGGITIDWSTVAAVAGADVVLNDGTVIPIGFKFLRYGQVVMRITASGKFGPWDIAAADGRQLLTAVEGDAFFLNRTVLELDPAGDYGGVACYGGLAYKSRLIQSGVAAHTLAAGPTLAELLAMFPELRLVNETPTA
jgi:hypothetical protein